MKKLQQWVKDFIQKEDGPTAVEYAVMLALIIVVCLTAITTLGSNANSTFTTVGQKIGAAECRHRGIPGFFHQRVLSLERTSTMKKLQQWVKDFIQKEDGPTAVEYAVMLALIIVVCLTAITTLGSNANSTFTTVGQKIGAS